ncbi:alpha/beta hydrolase family protein [Chitinimonas sp. PSY-7]|uniref:alpha/beta fold hydrolase n=1 Tax=Chitinimonas sp. PSY-7 TaxID=3459088 RepID=UPI00403FDC79
MMHKLTTLTVATADGYSLAVRRYEPTSTIQGTVLLVSAMGVSQNYYAPFASWLAEQGWLAISFDYRGMGDSRHGLLRELDIDVVGWAEHDCTAMLDWAVTQSQGRPLVWIGHSLGGQLVGLTPNINLVDHVITIAAGSGYWRENAAPLKRKAWLLWFGFAPLLTPAFGYFPGRRLGMVGDLPAKVMQQWRRWCLHCDYAIGVEGDAIRQRFAEVNVPITAFSFSDDEMMSSRNITSLHGFYTNSRVQIQRIKPQDMGLGRIGHFGFFKTINRDTLWQPLIQPQLKAVERSTSASPANAPSQFLRSVSV